MAGSYIGFVYNPSASERTVSGSFFLPVGKIIVSSGSVRSDGATLTIDGVPGTQKVAGIGLSGAARIYCFEFENTVAATRTVEVTHSSPNTILEKAITIYSVGLTDTVEYFPTSLPKSSLVDDYLIFSSLPNNAAAIIPDATNSLTVDYNQDIRSSENYYSAHYDGATTISTNASIVQDTYFTVIATPAAGGGNTASGGATSPSTNASGAATQSDTATGNATAPAATTAGSATQTVSASGGATTPAATASGVAKIRLVALGGAIIPAITASGATAGLSSGRAAFPAQSSNGGSILQSSNGGRLVS